MKKNPKGLALFLDEAGDYSAGQWVITTKDEVFNLQREQESLGRKFVLCVYFGDGSGTPDLPQAASSAFLNLANYAKERGQAIG